jgi:NagD protein
VVVSFDRGFDYEKLRTGYLAVRAGARIVATNPDAYCPTPDGGLPDCGAILAALEVATGARAEAVVGKPSAFMAARVLARLGTAARDTMLVGDRIETDVRMAREAGMVAALVLTGATTAEAASSSDEDPDLILASVADIMPVRVGDGG